MQISEATLADLDSVKALISEVSRVDVLSEFTDEGRQSYQAFVIDALEEIFDRQAYVTLKACSEGKIVGVGAIKNGDYLSHLFVDKSVQGQGVGHLLLKRLMSSSSKQSITLRSSLNAVRFYERQGFNVTGPESQVAGIRFIPMEACE
ncbi:GNAT family N-acetyltransferase [Thaumasiovibrio subtropicus]|uniref:GNAT family N-acetyltransferase n=1 Tax=Thaumasiovibrio subtropicus TaxID=1891207 RepID=UPI000B352E44|nr:GNAT family N-acetyltransferase [Thaumasiovibrio subtropicus]